MTPSFIRGRHDASMTFFNRWFAVLRDTFHFWSEGQAFVYAAALAFFTVFSIAPIVIVAVAAVGLVLGEEAASGQIMTELKGAIGPQAAEFVQAAVLSAKLDTGGTWATALGAALILVGATTVFSQMQNALNAIWEVSPKPDRSSVPFADARQTHRAPGHGCAGAPDSG
jgi:membrane protein